MVGFFDKAASRKGTNCYKWDGLEKSYGTSDLMPFWVADMEFETFPPVREAMEERIAKPVYSYTFADGGYIQSIVDWYCDRHHVGISEKELIPLPGVVMGIGHVLNLFTKEGDKVILNTPVYDSFFSLLRDMGRVVSDAPLRKEGERYFLDYDAIEARMKEGAKAYIFCSPHNPVGRVWTKEEIAKVAELCCQYGIPLISDEIHSDLVFGGHRHFPAFSVSEQAERCTFVLNSPSKTFNLASLKSAYIITKNPRYEEMIRREINMYHMGICFLGYLSTRVAYQKGAEWVDELNRYLEANAEFVYGYLKECMPRVKAYVPEGTFLMWLDFTEYGFSQQELMDILVKKAGLALSSGTAYGPAYEGFVRFNIGAPREFIREGLEKLSHAFEV